MNLLDVLEKYAVPALIVVIMMYFTVDDLKVEMRDMKESLKMLAENKVEITKIEERSKGLEWRIGDHEVRLKNLERK